MVKLFSLIPKTYQLKPLTVVKRVKTGFLSHNWILETEQSQYFLKQYRITDRSRVQEIHEAKAFFSQKGIPVILPLPNIQGDTITSLQGKHFTLFPFINGPIINRTNYSEKHFRAAGAMLAKIHSAGMNAPSHIFSKQSSRCSLEKFKREYEAVLNAMQQDKFFDIAYSTMNLKKSLVENECANYLDLGLKNDHLIHGDYHGNNIFFDNIGDIKHVFDFEKTEMAPRSYELARSIDFMCLSNNYGRKELSSAGQYLSSYNQNYPIDANEITRGFYMYFCRKAHSLWVEKEHYLNHSQRVDHFLADEIKMLTYYSQNIHSLVNAIIHYAQIKTT